MPEGRQIAELSAEINCKENVVYLWRTEQKHLPENIMQIKYFHLCSILIFFFAVKCMNEGVICHTERSNADRGS